MNSGEEAKTILVIEDNTTNMELVSVLLEVAGFRVVQAPNAEVGLALAAAHTPDLILMDVGLPGMDGLHATELMRADARTRHIPIVVVTAHAMRGDETKALAAGCVGYIAKPIQTRGFADRVKEFLVASPQRVEPKTEA